MIILSCIFSLALIEITGRARGTETIILSLFAGRFQGQSGGENRRFGLSGHFDAAGVTTVY